MMLNVKWNLTFTATSSITHSDQALGTITYLRREKFYGPDGTVHDVPVVSGNSLRGRLRNVSADLMWSDLGEPQFRAPIAHAIWSGGAVVKAKGEPLSGQRLALLRQAAPHVSLFGAAGGGRIVDGSLAVGKVLPVCEELRHVLPAHVTEGPLPSMWDILQIEYTSRFPTAPPDAIAPDSGDEGNLMRFGTETFIAGTRFASWLQVRRGTDAEVAHLDRVLDTYRDDAVLGGSLARGHGRVVVDVHRTGPQATAPEPVDPAVVVERLKWLD